MTKILENGTTKRANNERPIKLQAISKRKEYFVLKLNFLLSHNLQKYAQDLSQQNDYSKHDYINFIINNLNK